MIVDLEYRGEKVYRNGEFFAKNECDACRKLMDEDARPGISNIARFWRAGKTTHDLEMYVAVGSKHYVSETRSHGPRFRPYDRIEEMKRNFGGGRPQRHPLEQEENS